jgi:heme exporter protein C
VKDEETNPMNDSGTYALAQKQLKNALLLILLTTVPLAVGWGVALFGLGADKDQGDVYRIMFVHVPVAWCAFVWVITAAVFAVRLFINPAEAQRFDRSGHASVELGTLFAVLALITGSIWGRPTWGVWWDWDPRLTSTLVLFLVCCGYLILRSFTPDPKSRRTTAAVVALLAALNVPIVYFSVNLWRSLHQPQSFVAKSSPVSSDIRMVLWFNVFAMVAFSIALYRARRQSLAAQETLEICRAQDQN